MELAIPYAITLLFHVNQKKEDQNDYGRAVKNKDETYEDSELQTY
jgi:hypothetical protein